MTYTLTSGTTIIRDADQAFIPNDPANMDYVAYLKWLDEGNTPNPYVEPPAPEPVKPTVEELQAQLAAIQKQLVELAK